MSLLTRFRKSLLEQNCLPGESRVLVAVSGGADSVALLSLLVSVKDEFNLELEVAHLDHALRDVSSLDASFVSKLCDEFALHLTQKRIDVADIARQRKGNLEEVARDVRREFLVEAASQNNCDCIALGHHLNDQVETLLMRMIRGSGTKGLAGMSYCAGQVLRPLLPFKRSEIIEYLLGKNLSWREDESNQDLDFMRNRVRSHLVPLLESFNPNVTQQIATLTEQLQQDELFWDRYVSDLLASCMSEDDEGFCLDRTQLVEMEVAESGRVVRAVFEKVRGDLRGLISTHIQDVLKLAHCEAPQGELTLPGAWVARRYDKLLFRQHKPDEPESYEVSIDAPGLHSVPGGALQISFEERRQGEDRFTVEFSQQEVAFPLVVRSPVPGDRLQPSGMQGSKKLQDLFVDLKMTREDRSATLLLCKDDAILWVVGVRRSNLFLPAPEGPVLRIVFVPE